MERWLDGSMCSFLNLHSIFVLIYFILFYFFILTNTSAQPSPPSLFPLEYCSCNLIFFRYQDRIFFSFPYYSFHKRQRSFCPSSSFSSTSSSSSSSTLQLIIIMDFYVCFSRESGADQST